MATAEINNRIQGSVFNILKFILHNYGGRTKFALQ